MSGHSTYVPKHPAAKWLESRLPIIGLVHSSFVVFPNPRNLNYWWTFGGILSFMLVSQIITGVVLAMHYTANSDLAFASVEHIMRDVNDGWLLRYWHANGASMFFLALYIHIFRGMYYGSYKAPREVLWLLGFIIYLLSMATAFMGYVLPWGQMSFWGATVITSLFSAIPLVGDAITTWLWGGYSVDNATLNRFYSLHYLLPFMIAGVVVLHIWALHVPGSNNPAGVEPKTEKDTLPFHPYFTAKDGFALACFLVFYAWFVFYIPNYLGHADNYIEANPLKTPPHIVPGMVLSALLRDPALNSLEARRIFGHVRRGADPRGAALARHLEGQIRLLSSVVPHLLLDFRRRRRAARLYRLATSRRRLRHRRTHPHRLLFLPLPGDPAASRPFRENAPAARIDRRRRSRQDGAPQPRSRGLTINLFNRSRGANRRQRKRVKA